MSLLRNVWLGKRSLAFTFWIMGCLAPTPIFAAKYYLKEAGVFARESGAVFIAGQGFLWLEWLYFAFITVALWNASCNHLARARLGGMERAAWGHAGRVLAIASGALALGSLANLSGLTALLFGRSLFIGLGAG